MGTAIADARRTLEENRPNGRITEKVEATRHCGRHHSVAWQSNRVRAGGAIDVTAKNNNEVQQTVGVIQANFASAGGSVIVTTVELPVNAQIVMVRKSLPGRKSFCRALVSKISLVAV